MFPDKNFQSAFGYSLKAEPRMRIKFYFYTWNKTGANVVGVDVQIIYLLLICSTTVNLPAPAAVSSTAQVVGWQEAQLRWFTRDLNHHRYYWSGPALLCTFGQKAMSSSPHILGHTESLNRTRKVAALRLEEAQLPQAMAVGSSPGPRRAEEHQARSQTHNTGGFLFLPAWFLSSSQNTCCQGRRVSQGWEILVNWLPGVVLRDGAASRHLNPRAARTEKDMPSVFHGAPLCGWAMGLMLRLGALRTAWSGGCIWASQSWVKAHLSHLCLAWPWVRRLEPQFSHLKNSDDNALLWRQMKGLWICPVCRDAWWPKFLLCIWSYTE